MTNLLYSTFLQVDTSSPKPTLIGGIIFALIIGYIIVGQFRGKNFKKGTNKGKHGTDNFWWIIVAIVILLILISKGKIR